MKAWVASDKDGNLNLFFEEMPVKHHELWMQPYNSNYIGIESCHFQQVKWEDEEPTEVEITIKIKED